MSDAVYVLTGILTPILGLTFVLIVICRTIINRSNRAEELRERARKAREDILADGIVEGPKGDYVPHKKWDVGIGMRTPSDNTPPKSGRGYHGMPLP